VTLDLDRASTSAELPTTPWRFTDFAGSAGVVLVVTGLAGLAIGIAAGRSPLRRESAGLGMAALVFAAILLGQGRLDPILALGGDGEGGAINPDDLAMITRGEEVYQTNCLTCHGPELRGDGPTADGMQPPPADFAEAHTMVHDEATLIYWVRNGKQGTAMPGFSDTLSDQEIRDVLSFIERRQRALTGDRSVPDPVACTVAPRDEGDLNSLTALTIEEGPSGELIPADNPEVGSGTVDAISAAVTEMLACVDAGDLPRASALFTDNALAWAFATGREPFGTPAALPEDDRIELVSMGGFTTLANDMVAVRVSIRDPEGALEPLARDFDTSGDVQELTIVLAPSGSSWLIDEIRP
ncbi:MAG TPA: cytochrome c, partial [Thermomicrobiales bacterium]|nr:cytochrome c [Thermomicrobiales bacterium]